MAFVKAKSWLDVLEEMLKVNKNNGGFGSDLCSQARPKMEPCRGGGKSLVIQRPSAVTILHGRYRHRLQPEKGADGVAHRLHHSVTFETK